MATIKNDEDFILLSNGIRQCSRCGNWHPINEANQWHLVGSYRNWLEKLFAKFFLMLPTFYFYLCTACFDKSNGKV